MINVGDLVRYSASSSIGFVEKMQNINGSKHFFAFVYWFHQDQENTYPYPISRLVKVS